MAFVTLSTVHLPHPEGGTEFVGYDEEGNPLMKPKILVVVPGEPVEIEDEKIIASLLSQRAICTPEDYREPSADDPNRFPKELGSGAEFTLHR